MNATIFILILLAVFVVVFAATGIRIVQQSQTILIERLGKYHRTLSSGINIIIPIVDVPRKITWRYVREDFEGRKIVNFKTRDRIDLRETVYDFPTEVGHSLRPDGYPEKLIMVVQMSFSKLSNEPER